MFSSLATPGTLPRLAANVYSVHTRFSCSSRRGLPEPMRWWGSGTPRRRMTRLRVSCRPDASIAAQVITAVWAPVERGPGRVLVACMCGHVMPASRFLGCLITRRSSAISPPSAVIIALDRSLRDGRLILTCRTGEYAAAVQAAGDVVASAAVVELEPLTPPGHRRLPARSPATQLATGMGQRLQEPAYARARDLATAVLAETVSTRRACGVVHHLPGRPETTPTICSQRRRTPDQVRDWLGHFTAIRGPGCGTAVVLSGSCNAPG
jgi:hypothetical protein